MLFAGAFAMNRNTPIPDGLKSQLSLALSRRPQPTSVHDTGRFFIVGAGVGSDFKPDVDGSLAVLCGDPILPVGASRLQQEARSGRTEAFRRARGTYCFVHYDAPNERLWLVADHVGLRPIYYTAKNGVIVFASALRILEAASLIEKRVSLEAMIELSCLDFLLAEHTPYENIFVIRESEIIETTERGIRRLTYDEWPESEVTPEDPKATAAHLMDTFNEAVGLRAGPEREALAYLSGGLDSRAIVAALIERGIAVTGLNFSPAGSQDRVYAEGFARAAGPTLQLHYFERHMQPNYSLLAKEALGQMRHEALPGTKIWSGDGGSVGLGHVYMDEAMVERLEANDLGGAAVQFLNLNRFHMPAKIFAGPVRKKFDGYLKEAIVQELRRRPRRDAGRSLYLFLLFNDQRRHLFKHFETMDEHGLEFHLPFFDADFLKAVASTPVRLGILHRLYMNWFEYLPPFSRATPWQAYPGHVPCPLSSAETLDYQWSPPRQTLRSRVRTAASLVKSLTAGDLAPGVFSKKQIALAAVIHLAGVRDNEYVLGIVRQFRQHQSHCNVHAN
jgi:asparagine synthetase B (glutamine-hydrolysing)